MENVISYIGCLTGLVAIWYTIRESRRNNSVIINVDKCEASSCQSSENNGQSFSHFRIIFRNNGIPLHKVSASISFRIPGTFTNASISLKRQELSGDRDEFSKGMIVEFQIKSYELTVNQLSMVATLNQSEKAFINIYSQDYLAASFQINGFVGRMKMKWNGFASRFNQKFIKKIGTNPEGIDVIHMPKILPKFKVLGFHTNFFIECIKAELDNK
ncbi:MAG: hypothetical protein HRT89_03955 [Lentisphaeria bacterium]|nr:hypothetical protein [Lentisphaeria bacterium]NQZ67204.1 hypothetical protein [Lentisphaeria bacterium]